MWRLTIAGSICTIFVLIVMLAYKSPGAAGFNNQLPGGATGVVTGDLTGMAGADTVPTADQTQVTRISGPTTVGDGTTTVRVTTRNGKIVGVSVEGDHKVKVTHQR